jgi:thymidine kinase
MTSREWLEAMSDQELVAYGDALIADTRVLVTRTAPPIKVKRGSIELIVGPMFSGKSTELLRRVRRLKAAKKTWLPLVYGKDNRFSDASEDLGATHDGDTFEARKVLTLEEVPQTDIDGVEWVVLDEAQFFPHLAEHIERWAAQGKNVIIAALNGTWQREPFPEVSALYALQTKLDSLNAICSYCGESAPYSKRLTQCTELEEIGGADKYAATCADCFFL